MILEGKSQLVFCEPAIIIIRQQQHATTAMRNSTRCKQVTWLAASVSAAAGILWYILRRPCRYLSKNDLPPCAVSDGLEVVQELNKEERNVIQTAFLSGNDFRWIVGGKDHKVALNEDYHRGVTFSLIEYMIAFSERYGHILVCRDEDGTLLGMIGLIPPYRSYARFTVHFYRTVLSYGKPPALDMGDEIAARFKAFEVMSELHKDSTKGIPHWYIQVIGVSDKAQGKGIGTKLMNAAIAMAGGLPMYLDCHNENVSYYEQFGFRVEKKVTIVPKGIQDTSTLEMNGMVRDI